MAHPTIYQIYKGRVSLEFRRINEDFMYMRQADPTAGANKYSAESYVQTQANILQSETPIERVLAKLNKSENTAQSPSRLAAWSKIVGMPDPPPVNPGKRLCGKRYETQGFSLLRFIAGEIAISTGNLHVLNGHRSQVWRFPQSNCAPWAGPDHET